MQNFSKCKVGDKLWSIHIGECFVAEVGGTFITVDNGRGSPSYSYDMEGKFCPTHAAPTLFFSDPHIIAPPPPKRMVKKRLWVVVVLSGGDKHGTTCAYSSEKDALEAQKWWPVGGTAVGSFEIEVEE